ncbi:MAG: hypothetical protein NTW17_03730, partial [Candidatus Pacearchaeota archaeon]|nr:hypothetical protein [Candidatus Pacearchaeota archaeon]
LQLTTAKQEGDIAGSKLLKFHRHLKDELSKFFDIKAKGFEYSNKKTARGFFAAKKKKEILISGPEVSDEKNVKGFKLKHKVISIKNGRLFSRIKVDFTLKQFIKKWEEKNKEKMQNMHISKLEIVD